MKNFGVLLIGVGALLVPFALSHFSHKIERSQSETIAIERCIDLKGVPVFHGWTGNMTGCVWPSR